MNERIQQLWRQVELQECDCGCNPDEFLRLKFAQLLVKECAGIAETAEPYQSSDLIKQHFGVEE
jgi:hypothetical protein